MPFIPTTEQQRVIEHYQGHARVLAVAGSGKTTTMVHRIKHLIDVHKVDPKKIRVLMFNTFASDQFKEKVKENIVTVAHPYISTFHSFSFQFIQKAIKDGVLQPLNLWIGDEYERYPLALKRVIVNLEQSKKIKQNSADLEDALKAIGLWKGALIPPDRAGHRYNDNLPIVYKAYEAHRAKVKALTFDDFIPTALRLLFENPEMRKQWSNRIEHLIVDEYQDVNLGQQKLIELLAGDTANIMVVGDDDQTIYEWRGARPEYIIKEFESAFTSKPHSIYKLSRSFRFGPIIAQCAQNTIMHNSTRQEKNVIAHNISNQSQIHIYKTNPDQATDVNKELAVEIHRLVTKENVSPSKIWVIGRMYSQLSGLESRFIAHKIPYKVLGNKPFYQKREIEILLSYLNLFSVYKNPLNNRTNKSLAQVINVPNRKIKKKVIQDASSRGIGLSISLEEFFTHIEERYHDQFSIDSLNSLNALNKFLAEGYEKINLIGTEEGMTTGEILAWAYSNSGLSSHYENFYGPGEHSIERNESIKGFIYFAKDLQMSPEELIQHVSNIDSTQGASEDQIITMTTVHKTKGLEFDYVIIPDCYEGFMPFLKGTDIPTYDKKNPNDQPKASEAIENERRLFYVALTRAIKAAYIGTSELKVLDRKSQHKDANIPSRFLEEIRLNISSPVLKMINEINELNVEDWLEHFKKIAGQKQIAKNVIVYLKELGHNELLSQAALIEAETPEDPFTYSIAYESGKSLEEKNLDPWGQIDL
jgi:DNA helicase-2/ATP-dependent DNA helicase PcrA